MASNMPKGQYLTNWAKQPRTEEWKKGQSERAKILWSNPEWKLKMINIHKKRAEKVGRDFFASISKKASHLKVLTPSEIAVSRKIWRYNINRKQYQEMYEKQNGVCAICGGVNKNELKSPLDIDHNHKTGVVRGLICRRCNLFISFLEKDGLLKAALSYLKAGVN